MSNVGALNYKLNANTAGFQKGMVLSGNELRSVRREMTKSKSSTERLQERLDKMQKAVEAGVIEIEDYDRAFHRLNAETDEAKAAAAELAAAQKEAADITRRLMTDEERRAEGLAKLNRLKPHLSEQAYARALEEANRNTPQAIAQRERLARSTELQKRRQELLRREMERGRQTMRSMETATERYDREMRELSKQLRRGAIDQRTFDRAARQSKSALNDHRASIAAQIPGLGRFSGLIGGMPPQLAAAGLAIGAITAGMYALGRGADFVSRKVSEQMTAVDKDAKMAARLGMDLQQLTAIQLAGSEVSGLEEAGINMAMQRMTRRFAEAAQGGGEAKDVIKQLGLDAAELSRQDPAIIFRRVADEVRKIKDPAEQVRVAFKLFDSEGVGLVSLLRQGSEAIDEADAAARRLGASTDEIGAAKIEAANEAIARTQMAFDGMFKELAVELGPFLQVSAQWATEFLVTSRALTGEFKDLSMWAARFAGDVMDTYDLMVGIATFDVSQAWSGLTNSKSNQMLQDVAVARSELEKAAEERKKALDQQRADNVTQAGIEAAKEQAEANKAIDEAIKKHQEIIDKEKRASLEAKIGKHRLEQIELIKEGATRRQIEELRRLQKKTAEIEKHKKLEEEAKKAAKEKAEAEKKAAEKRAADKLAAVEKKREELDKRGEQLRQQFLTPFEKLVEELADVKELAAVGSIHSITARRAMAAAQDDFSQATRQRFAPVITRNSAEAYSELLRRQGKLQDDARKIAAHQLAAIQANQNNTARLVELAEAQEGGAV